MNSWELEPELLHGTDMECEAQERRIHTSSAQLATFDFLFILELRTSMAAAEEFMFERLRKVDPTLRDALMIHRQRLGIRDYDKIEHVVKIKDR